jgi:copper homeostasis protein
MPLVEAAVDTLQSALSAERAGAGRIELCAGLNDAGTTPSAGLIAACANRCRIPVFVLIRPRGGSFVYSNAEFEIMMRDVDAAKSLGATGIVSGALGATGKIDVEQVRALVRAAAGLPVTFHRAFDFTPNLAEALEALVEAGVTRILTSGGANTALEGASRISALVMQAGERVTLIAAGGIRESNVREVLTLTGVSEVHARISSIVGGTDPLRAPQIKLRKRFPDNEAAWAELDEGRMRDLVRETV